MDASGTGIPTGRQRPASCQLPPVCACPRKDPRLRSLPKMIRRILIAVCLLPTIAAAAAKVSPLPADAPAFVRTRAFPLVAEGRAAPIVFPANAPTVVRIAARDFADDVKAITGVRPEVQEAPSADLAGPRVELVLDPRLAGHWEAFQLTATPETLTVAGADRRALAYGLYEVSRRIGVSPWAWWADVPPVRRDELHLSAGSEPVDQPAVRYRGIFLNDEGWGLRPWAAKTFEPEVDNIGPRTYGRIFELLLRLRGNTIWPAMHPGTIPFHKVPGNADIADDYAIVVGSSHAEPMLRNNVGEWTQEKDRYNYLTNRAGILEYWEERVRERTSGESLFTIGMRGIHDSGIVGPKSQAERMATLEQIFADQRDLLARHLGDGDPTNVAQIFVPYKEVLEDYNAGLQVPEDVVLVWPDDNFGYVRRFATPAERARAGGLGIYYHLSYLGAPLSWLWFDSLSPALIWAEMTRAYEQGAQAFWIGNVGDLKGTELSTEFFLHLAWHADRTDLMEPRHFLHRVTARDFGEAHAEAIADLLARHQHLAVARKPEHLQWHIPLTPYQPTELTEEEIHRRLDAYSALVADMKAIDSLLLPQQHDAFFQLVRYPIEAAAAANERYFRAELGRLERARGEEAASENFAAVDLAEQRIRELTLHYNDGIAGGKWRNIMTINGLSPREWRRYQPDPAIVPLNSPAQDAVRAPEPIPDPEPSITPADAHPGDFVEHAGVVSIHAGHFTAREDLPSKAGWRSVPGLGRTGSAITILPSTATFDAATAPRVSYRFHVATGGPATLHIRLLPTFPIVPGNGLRLAIAIDDGQTIPVEVTAGLNPGSDAWKERVLANATETTLQLPEPLEPGWHTLHLAAVDAGVVVDKFVIDLGGLRPSYDGPQETVVP